MRISDWSSDVCSSVLRAGNEGDYLFMLLYAGFVGCGLFALWRELRSRVLFAAIALPVAAALCDAWENTLLFDIQTAFTLGDYSPAMASLPWPVAAKFILLALANIAVGHGMMQLGRRWQLPAALATAPVIAVAMALAVPPAFGRSEEHTSELQSLMRISYAVFRLKKK